MTEPSTEVKVISTSDIEVDRKALNASIAVFAEPNSAYYAGVFHKIHDTTNLLPKTFNFWAAVLGPLWSASRAIWGMFWTFLVLEVIAWVQIGRGAWGNPGADLAERAERQQARAQDMLDRAAATTERADIDRSTNWQATCKARPT